MRNYIFTSLIGLFFHAGMCFAQTPSAEEGLRDVAPLVDLPLEFVWVLELAFFILVILLIRYLLRYWRKTRAKREGVKEVIQKTPWEKAYERLRELEMRHFLEQGQYNLFYSELTGIVRYFIEELYHIQAPEMTTEEFLRGLKLNQQLSSSDKQMLEEFLTSADLVKFARKIPSINDAKGSFELAKNFINNSQRPQ
ncbi:MAG: hypothetical protein KC713_07130 [Candidatus Omnitrophica bacterium]|nr:hypothetical protein [Candidatus Omnitrophota bacterium]